MAEEEPLSGGTIKISLNGSDLPENLFQAVEKVVVEDEINLPSMFTITFNIMNFEDQAFQGLDLETFKLGDELKILMGSDKTEEMMVGEITALEPTFGTKASMEIRGFDRLHKLRFGKYRRSFLEVKDSDIASTIASDVGLSPDAEDTGTTHAYLFQNNETNYEFLVSRAKRIDYELTVKDKTLSFKPSQEEKAHEISLENGIDLESFSTQLRVITEGSEVEVRGWDMTNKEEISSTAGAGSERSKMGGDDSGFDLSEAVSPSPTAIVDHAIVDATDAENVGKAKYNAMIKQFMTGSGSISGNPLVRAGKTVEIKGIGKRFSGVYYITSSKHMFTMGGSYMTNFKVKRTGI